MEKLPVTVIIPVKNEAANMPRCLDSVAWADEIVVVDSGSTDETKKISESFGARVELFTYAPPWPKKKQWALDNLNMRNDWVLLLDADEVMPPNSAEVFGKIIQNDGKNPDGVRVDGYWIDRCFFFLGAAMKHAYTPNWNLRFFRRGSCHFERLTSAESNSGDNEVHEHLLCSGRTAQLPQIVMDHHAFPTFEIFMEKHIRYAAWEAAVELHPQGGKASEKLSVAVALRRLIKKISRALPFRPFLRFLWVGIGQRAFWDGPRGFLFARLHGLYESMISIRKAERRILEGKKR